MNDDETGSVIKRTDLSNEVPTPRADLYHEVFEVEGHTDGRGGASGRVSAKFFEGSSLSMAMATLALTLAVGVVIGIAFGIGIPPIGALIAGVCVALGAYVLVYRTSRQKRRRRQG
jgi:Flp pilus assembly protein TadB